MTVSDLTLLAPFIAAILLAVAILVVDFIAPEPHASRRSLVTFIGLTLVGALIVVTGQHPGDARSAAATSWTSSRRSWTSCSSRSSR